MGHTGDDAICKIPHKMKTLWWSQLKISVRVQFDILYRLRYQKIDVILVQCPFNVNYKRNDVFVAITNRYHISVQGQK